MLFEHVGSGEGVGAERALEGSFASVPPQVSHQDRVASEPPIAHRTRVWTVPRVSSLVADQVGLVRQTQWAHAALEGALSGVYAHVTLEVCAREIALVAIFAAEGAQAFVSTHVFHQAVPGVKALGADAAAVLLAVLVHAFVFRELVLSDESSTALGAVERPFGPILMHFRVHCQLLCSTEGPLAARACKLLRSSLVVAQHGRQLCQNSSWITAHPKTFESRRFESIDVLFTAVTY